MTPLGLCGETELVLVLLIFTFREDSGALANSAERDVEVKDVETLFSWCLRFQVVPV